jgi:hypothetical protein
MEKVLALVLTEERLAVQIQEQAAQELEVLIRLQRLLEAVVALA